MMRKINFKRVFLLAMIISLAISAFIGIFILLVGNFGNVETSILLTTLTLGFFSLTGLCCATLYEKRGMDCISLLGIIFSIGGFFYTVFWIWKIIAFDHCEIFSFIFIIISFSLAHSSLLLLIRSENSVVKYSQVISVVFICIVALMLILFVLQVVEDYPGAFYIRLLGVFAILDALGTAVTPILHKVYSMQNTPGSGLDNLIIL
jgi:hypothetical protein